MGHIFWNERIRLIDSGENVDVLAIGDSWFHYPFNNLITPLYSALAQPTVYVIGENGARADELAAGVWRMRFRAMLAEQPMIRLVCISAGGNDFAGLGDLDAKILKPDCTAAATADDCCLRASPTACSPPWKRRIERCYAMSRSCAPACRCSSTTTTTRFPTGARCPACAAGSSCRWTTAASRPRRRRSPAFGATFVRTLIDHFTLRLDALASAPVADLLAPAELIWSAGTLADSAWANELHPALQRIRADRPPSAGAARRVGPLGL
jgi:hypothetical protein